MKKLLIALLFFFPLIAHGQIHVDQGGTGLLSVPANSFLLGASSLRLTSSSSPAMGWLTATSTTASSTLNNTQINGLFTVLNSSTGAEDVRFDRSGAWGFGTSPKTLTGGFNTMRVAPTQGNSAALFQILGATANDFASFSGGLSGAPYPHIDWSNKGRFTFCTKSTVDAFLSCTVRVSFTEGSHVLIGSESDVAALYVKAAASSTAVMRIASSTATSNLEVAATGFVGVASTSPTKTFSVQGDSYVSGTSFLGGAVTATSTIDATGKITSESLTVLHGLASTTATSASDSTSPKSVTALCAAGYSVIGGGGSTTPAVLVAIVGSQPNAGGNGWTMTGAETPATASNWQVSAYAICAKYN